MYIWKIGKFFIQFEIIFSWLKSYCIEFYHFCEGFMLGVRNEIQYRPMLWPLTQASPFFMEPRFSATGSFPAGALKTVCSSAMKRKVSAVDQIC